jgi:hypothetical protein
MVWGILIGLVALLGLAVLVGSAWLSTLGLEPDQEQVKRQLRQSGHLALLLGIFGDFWLTIFGAFALTASRLNLRGISQTIDRSLSGEARSQAKTTPTQR